MGIQELHPLPALLLIALLAVVWTIYIAIYRLWFHPLAKFPGPALAKLTYWYEFYYDVILDGQYTFKLKSLHDQYGPIIRLNPDELHINDGDYYDEVFNNWKNVEKTIREAKAFGHDGSTVTHSLHRQRRTVLNPFFSKRSVYDLSPLIQETVDSLCSRFTKVAHTGDSINIKYAYTALSMDIINKYCFAKTSDCVKVEDFDQKMFDIMDGFLFISTLNYHLPWVIDMVRSFPDWLLKLLFPAVIYNINVKKSLSKQIEAIRTGKDHSKATTGHRTVFHEILSSDLPPETKTNYRLREEAFNLLSAGSSTVAHTLKILTYHISANPHIQKTLFEELQTVEQDLRGHFSLPDLEKLPYLTAVIYESLRIGRSVTHRLSRVFPDKVLQYHDQTIPLRTPVNMTSMLIHEDEKIFPDPHAFKPERWLSDTDRPYLLRYMTPFSRGTRACLGINLAWAELYLILAHVFRRFTFDIGDVVRERDIDCTRDMLVGMPVAESKGMIVKIQSIK